MRNRGRKRCSTSGGAKTVQRCSTSSGAKTVQRCSTSSGAKTVQHFKRCKNGAALQAVQAVLRFFFFLKFSDFFEIINFDKKFY